MQILRGRRRNNLGIYPASGGIDRQVVINQIDDFTVTSALDLDSLAWRAFIGVDHVNLPSGRVVRVRQYGITVLHHPEYTDREY